jgi:hypothetical protein
VTRPDPERIDEAKRAGNRNRLTGEGIPEALVDAWLAAWVAANPRQAGDHEYWRRAQDWISSEHAAGRRAAL